MKRHENQARREARARYKALAMQLEREGNKQKALEYFQRASTVTPEMAQRLQAQLTGACSRDYSMRIIDCCVLPFCCVFVLFILCVSVIPLLAMGVPFVVSPYEADAQLAYLYQVRPTHCVQPTCRVVHNNMQ